MILRQLIMKLSGNLRQLLADQSGFLKLGSRGIGVIFMIISLAIIVPLIARYTDSWLGFWAFIVLAVIPLFNAIHSFADFMAHDDKDEKDKGNSGGN